MPRRRSSDEEDLALSAFQSLYQGICDGRFPRLDDRDDLWRLLVHLTACKAVDRLGPRMTEARGRQGRQPDRHDRGRSRSATRKPLDRIIGSEPSPEFAAMVAEDYRRRLDELGDETLRRIAELKLACYSNEEIRQQLGCSLRTVTLRLELIRRNGRMGQRPGRAEPFT